jgi:hypothetical protein
MGGDSNTVSGQNSSVLGGLGNTASGTNSMAFGLYATASGNNAIALGRRAKAVNNGTFVFTDQNDTDLSSTTTNRFITRFSGGYRFFTNTAQTAGVSLTSGSSSWASISDENKKEHIFPIDYTSVYSKMMTLPVYSWNYKHSPENERHYGPMAQDFNERFGWDGLGVYGSSDGIINMHMASLGIASLNHYASLSSELDTEIKSEIDRQKKLLKKLAELEARLTTIERSSR